MAGEPTIIGATSAITAWATVFDYPAGDSSGLRIRVRQGPATSLSTEIAALKAALDIETLDPSVSLGSALATIRTSYRTAGGVLPLNERRSPVYATTPMMEVVDIRAHPKSQPIAAEIPTIERYIASGDIAGLKAAYAGNASALYFAALWVAGVTSYEAPAFQLSVTRFYTNPPTIAADYATINKVFAWSAIRTDNKTIPSYVDEPKYVTAAGVATPFEWRLISVAPVVTRGQENVVTWIFIGRDKWAKELYNGGTWEPQAL
jgi:hypothetical protein